MKRFYKIRGGVSLKGEVQISGAKNAATKEIVASLLSSGICVLKNVPKIGDVETTIKICESLGVKFSWQDDSTLKIDSSNLKTHKVGERYSGKNRIPILLFGPLLHRFGKAEVPVLGGCEIGARPVGFHIEGLEKLGAKIECGKDTYIATAKKLHGAIIELPFPSVGATENLLIASSLAFGTTVIKNAAIEPEVVDLALFLQAMGAIIRLDTDRTWIVEGVEDLRPAEHIVINDRIEAASFAIAAVVTGGDVLVKGADQLHMLTFLNWLRRAGGEFKIEKEGIRFLGKKNGLKPVALSTGVHPGFMTDWQQPFTILLTQANGVSIVHETVYENRFGYTEALNKMGANIQLFNNCLGEQCWFLNKGFPHSAVISGPTPLAARDIEIPDLRAGFSYIVAALLASGESKLYNIEHIERGYSNIKEKFKALGAKIE